MADPLEEGMKKRREVLGDEHVDRAQRSTTAFDADFQDFERETSSPPLEVAEGNLRLPWFAIAFGGRHQLKIYALDDNWYDFARSSPETQNNAFGGLAGDNFERPIFSIEGGIGLFGSASIDSLGFFVLPRN